MIPSELIGTIPPELLKAMMNGIPVKHDPKYLISSNDKPTYSGINAIILRRGSNGAVKVQLELQDKQTSSVSIADPSTVTPIL